ncbi:hypothetical protein ABID56_000548 [Alkalibacillus flavidus]|uniref:Uncharacterized protein n=1 Tax=Alkalibacillus flavidus TaxID=546021 RepID=A0ABV2KSA7_9BACI
MRLIIWVLVIVLIFQFGFEVGHGDEQEKVNVIEEHEHETGSSKTFDQKHQDVMNEAEEDEGGLFHVAQLLEEYIKTIFATIFHVLYRLAVTFG